MNRKNATPQIAYEPAVGPARGILRQPHPNAGQHHSIQHHARRSPFPLLEPWIQHYWMVSWSLPEGLSQTVKTIPHPNIHLVFSSEGVHIHGIQPKLFNKTLTGSESVFGVKFRAGAFRPFHYQDVATLLGRTVPASSIFGDTINGLLHGQHTNEYRIHAANAYFESLIEKISQPNPEAVEAVRVCEQSPTIRTVADLAAHMASSQRSLQRLFREHVGATPKWVILRYRIHELVERINALTPGEDIDWATTALELGYFDQSHMIRDFRTITGYQPNQYRGLARGATP